MDIFEEKGFIWKIESVRWDWNYRFIGYVVFDLFMSGQKMNIKKSIVKVDFKISHILESSVLTL